jgi:hypothetical protein
MLSKHSTEGRHQVTLAALDELVLLAYLGVFKNQYKMDKPHLNSI